MIDELDSPAGRSGRREEHDDRLGASSPTMSARKKKSDKATPGGAATAPSGAASGRICWLVAADCVKRGASADGDLLDFVHAAVQLHPDDVDALGFVPDSCVLVTIVNKVGEDVGGGTVGVGRVWPVAAVKKVRGRRATGHATVRRWHACVELPSTLTSPTRRCRVC